MRKNRPFQRAPMPFLIVFLCICAIPVCQSFPSTSWQLEEIAKTAKVFATVKVESVSRSASPWVTGERTVTGRAQLLVLRSFPASAISAGEAIQLDYETPAGDSGMSGPSVPDFQPGSILVVPLKPNAKPATDAWRLFADQGMGLIIPAIEQEPAFASRPRNGREYLLQEVASALATGRREDVFRETWYLGITMQRTDEYASDIMRLLETRVSGDVDRWALISASLVSSFGVPRPSFGEFIAGKYGANPGRWPGSLVEASAERLARLDHAEDELTRQLLYISDINEWGAGIALQEFAQNTSLVQELRSMLGQRRPGSLNVAHNVMKAGQERIRDAAVAASLTTIRDPAANHSETQAACWVLRDFGNDAEFNKLVGAIREYQYRDQKRFDELWRDTLWSDNVRERDVLEILLADQRVYDSRQRYSDMARVELDRVRGLTPSTQ
jgi:hypothetical protein